MNLTDYTYLINKPDAMNERYNVSLEKIIEAFPYFQSARVLRLKHLYNQNSFKYNYALKITAAHTTDRTVLFDFITSDSFVTIHKGLYDKKVAELLDIPLNEIETINDDSPKLEQRINTVEESILISIKNATPAVEQETVVVENLLIEKPEFRIPSEKDYVAIETFVAEKTEESIIKI